MTHCSAPSSTSRPTSRPSRPVRSERGQTTAEYALLLLAAATIATLFLAWAANNGGLDSVFDRVVERINALVE